MNAVADVSPVRTLDSGAGEDMMAAIDRAKEEGDTLGGVFEVVARGVPVGLGSHVSWDRKLDGRLGQGRPLGPCRQGSRNRDRLYGFRPPWLSGP